MILIFSFSSLHWNVSIFCIELWWRAIHRLPVCFFSTMALKCATIETSLRLVEPPHFLIWRGWGGNILGVPHAWLRLWRSTLTRERLKTKNGHFCWACYSRACRATNKSREYSGQDRGELANIPRFHWISVVARDWYSIPYLLHWPINRSIKDSNCNLLERIWLTELHSIRKIASIKAFRFFIAIGKHITHRSFMSSLSSSDVPKQLGEPIFYVWMYGAEFQDPI